MSKKIKTLVGVLLITLSVSTTVFAAPIRTDKTFNGDNGNDVVIHADGTEIQYRYDEYDNVYYNEDPSVVKTVTQGEVGNNLRYDLNYLVTKDRGVSYYAKDTTYMNISNIEREDGFGIERVLYSHNPVKIDMQGTKYFIGKYIQKIQKYSIDNGSVVHVEHPQEYMVDTLDTGFSSYEISEPGLYFVMFDISNDYHQREKGIHLYLYIAKPGEDITKNTGSKVATPTKVDFNINGNHTNVPTYTINGSPYIRTKDLAYILNGTGKQISLPYNAGTNSTSINTVASLDNRDNSYKVTGNELSAIQGNTVLAEVSASKLAINGGTVETPMYRINGEDFTNFSVLNNILGLNATIYSDGIVINTPVKHIEERPSSNYIPPGAVGTSENPNYEKWVGLRPYTGQ